MTEVLSEIDTTKVLGSCLDQGVSSITPLSGGKNNRLFKVSLKDGSSVAAKFYFRHPSDPRDRLDTDYNAHCFLWNAGLRCIACPYLRKDEASLAVYSFIEGSKQEEFSTADIDQIVSFIASLKKLSNRADAALLPIAAEASFSAKDLTTSIEGRLNKLLALPRSKDGIESKFSSFLHDQLTPAFKAHTTALNRCKIQEFFTLPLPDHYRVLSPSDFGFHNALKNPDGTWYFHDFEYFGWDDPVKLLCDFILHPGMNLSNDLRSYFLKKCLLIFSDDPTLKTRLNALLPIYAIKWCIIILNEFVPEFRLRRGFAIETPKEQLQQILSIQLNKAIKLFSLINELMKPVADASSISQAPSILDTRSLTLRRQIVRTIEAGGRGHVGSAFSLVEILRVLYDDFLKFDPKRPNWAERDRCILSKGHGCLALYAILQDKGFFPEEELWKFCHSDGILGGHPEAGKIPGVEASTGSLGHGLSIGVGMALNAKREKHSHRVFVVTSDGECNEGSTWEAALCAGKHRLSNLTVMVDYNKQQSYGSTFEVLDLEPLADKWRAFNFAVEEVDGHDVNELRKSLSRTPFRSDKPSLIVCHTIKGKGIPFAESNPAWHHKSKISKEEVEKMLGALT